MHLSKNILDYRKKQTETLRISENINFTNDDVKNYVIGDLQQKLPRAPLPFNPALSAASLNVAVDGFRKKTWNGKKSLTLLIKILAKQNQLLISHLFSSFA